MLAARSGRRSQDPGFLPRQDFLALADLLSRRKADLSPLLAAETSVLIEESGHALLVSQTEPEDLPALLHARPGEIEFGVLEEADFPLLSAVFSLKSSGPTRYAGIIVDVGHADLMSRFNLMISQPSVDLAFLDADGRLAAAVRFELPLWARAAAHRAIDRARHHLESIPAGRRSFERARAGFQAYCTLNQTA
jgi:hypothetical protein